MNSQIIGVFQEFFDAWGYWEIGSFTFSVLGLLLAVICIVAALVVYKILTFALRKLSLTQGSSPDLYNGVKFFLRIIVAVIIVVVIITFLNIEAQYVVVVSGVVATAIAFASMKSINNFISGFWISFTRPFIVGDYVDIGGVEGIVIEISLNFTKIKGYRGVITLIPNIKLMNSVIINYTISTKNFEKKIEDLRATLKKITKKNRKKKLDDKQLQKEIMIQHLEEELQEREKRYDEIVKINSLLTKKDGAMKKKYSQYVRKGKIVRYSFKHEIKRDAKVNTDGLNKVCDKWTEEFDIRPLWRIMGHTYFLETQFTITTIDPEDIILYYSDFVEDIYKNTYKSN